MTGFLIRYLFRPVAAIAVFLLLAEALLHTVGSDPHPKGIDFIVNRAPDYPEAFLRDRDLFWRLRPGRTVVSEFFEGKSYRINKSGFRGDDFRLEKSGLRVAVLGNSCSFGWGVGDKETFAERLEDGLRRDPDFAGAEVYNFSVPGYSSFQGKRNYLRNVRPFRPDVLLVTFGWNDQWLSANNRPDKDQKLPPQVILDIHNVVGRLRFYRFLKGLIFSLAPRPETFEYRAELTRVNLADFKDNLGEIVAAARRDGTRVILLTSPIPSRRVLVGTPHPSIVYDLHQFYNDMTRETAADHSVELIDLAAVFDRQDGLFDDPGRDPFHYNRRGHAVAAEQILNAITAAP